MLNYSTSEENYIKAIFHLQGSADNVTTNELANELKTKPASVTDMMKKLKTKKLINYQPYQGFRLTGEGSKVALGIIRRHRLWEFFLAEKLKFTWDEVHEVAEELEHVSSEELVTRLDDFLGRPSFDPHGDPIPDHKGQLKKVRQVSLHAIPVKQAAAVQSVKNQSPELLYQLDHFGIGIGTKLRVCRRFEFDGSIEIKIDKQAPFILSLQVAKNIYCTL